MYRLTYKQKNRTRKGFQAPGTPQGPTGWAGAPGVSPNLPPGSELVLLLMFSSIIRTEFCYKIGPSWGYKEGNGGTTDQAGLHPVDSGSLGDRAACLSLGTGKSLEWLSAWHH